MDAPVHNLVAVFYVLAHLSVSRTFAGSFLKPYFCSKSPIVSVSLVPSRSAPPCGWCVDPGVATVAAVGGDGELGGTLAPQQHTERLAVALAQVDFMAVAPRQHPAVRRPAPGRPMTQQGQYGVRYGRLLSAVAASQVRSPHQEFVTNVLPSADQRVNCPRIVSRTTPEATSIRRHSSPVMPPAPAASVLSSGDQDRSQAKKATSWTSLPLSASQMRTVLPSMSLVASH